MVSVAICDDEKRVLSDISVKIKAVFESEGCQPEMFSTDDPFELLEYIRRNSVNAVFLDIDMPKLSGMDIAQFLTDNDMKTFLIFVTSHDSLVYESFRYHPFSFIRKGYFNEEIGTVVRSVIDQLKKKTDYFTFKTSEGFFRVLFSEILYFESESNYLNLHCLKGNYKFRSTISSIETELSTKGFLRTHKGFLVNQQHIYALRGDEIELSNKEHIPIGRTNKENIKNAVMRYMR